MASDIEVKENVATSVEETTPAPGASGGLVAAGWFVFALGVATPLMVKGPVSLLISLAVLVTSAIMVGRDAAKIGVKHLKHSSLDLSQQDRAPASSWVLGVIFLWIVFFPMYLVKRNKLAKAARTTVDGSLYYTDAAIEQTRRKNRRQSIVAVALLVAFVVLIFVGLPLIVAATA